MKDSPLAGGDKTRGEASGLLCLRFRAKRIGRFPRRLAFGVRCGRGPALFGRRLSSMAASGIWNKTLLNKP